MALEMTFLIARSLVLKKCALNWRVTDEGKKLINKRIEYCVGFAVTSPTHPTPTGCY